MKRTSLLLLVILATSILTGCSQMPGGVARLGEEFSIPIGQSETIKGENLKVTFVKVSEDSRCPTGAT